MKSYKASKRILSNEYMRAYKKIRKPEKFGQTNVLSMRSITPDGLSLKKGTKKNQGSFSYIADTQTPGVRSKSKCDKLAFSI